MTDEKRDKYLRKTYGISLADYKALLASQDGRCAICHKTPPPGGKALHTDHDHGYKKVKISASSWPKSENVYWYGKAIYNGKLFEFVGGTKRQVVKAVKEMLRRASVRGLLDWKCNTGLQKWHDRPELMESAAKYLRKHQGTFVVTAMLLFAVLLRATPAIRNIEMVVGPTTKSLIQFTPMFPTNLKVVQVSGPSVDEHDHLDCAASWEKIGEPVKDYQPGNLVLDCGHGRKFFVSELDFTPTAGR